MSCLIHVINNSCLLILNYDNKDMSTAYTHTRTDIKNHVYISFFFSASHFAECCIFEEISSICFNYDSWQDESLFLYLMLSDYGNISLLVLYRNSVSLFHRQEPLTFAIWYLRPDFLFTLVCHCILTLRLICIA
jgi:hypothetical protein